MTDTQDISARLRADRSALVADGPPRIFSGYKFQDTKLGPNRLCLEAAAEIDRLRAEVEALKVDAERYRWLRDHCEMGGLT